MCVSVCYSVYLCVVVSAVSRCVSVSVCVCVCRITHELTSRESLSPFSEAPIGWRLMSWHCSKWASVMPLSNMLEVSVCVSEGVRGLMLSSRTQSLKVRADICLESRL